MSDLRTVSGPFIEAGHVNVKITALCKLGMPTAPSC